MIYLDNASTTKCFESSAEIVKDALVVDYFNPSARYAQSLNSARKLNECRAAILDMVGASSNHGVVFTGSATEANNLVLYSSLSRHKHNIISIGEHASIFEPCKMHKQNGINIDELPLNGDGEVDMTEFSKLVTPQTEFVSVMLVSNETGAINNIEAIAKLAKKANPRCLVHVDAVQGFCKVNINMEMWGIDYLTISSHKVHGPKGVGALVYNKKAKLNPMILGGGQENNKRSGTENLPAILGFVNSAKILSSNVSKNYQLTKAKKIALYNEIMSQAKESNITILLNGNNETSSPYILSLSFTGLRGEVLLHSLEKEGIMVGTGSACSSSESDNRILRAMGRNKQEVEGNIRISLSAEELSFDEKEVATKIVSSAKRLKR